MQLLRAKENKYVSEIIVVDNDSTDKTGEIIIEIDEESKRMKLSYKQIHKTRGVRCRVPEYKIGFETIENKLASWMEEYEYDKKN